MEDKDAPKSEDQANSTGANSPSVVDASKVPEAPKVEGKSRAKGKDVTIKAEDHDKLRDLIVELRDHLSAAGHRIVDEIEQLVKHA